MADPTLLLWLEAPLQSWGFDSRFGRRDSLDFPTRSGVLGLLCCAMGAGGEQREWLAIMAKQTQTVLAFGLSQEGKAGAREALPRQPLLRDFHMVGSGYDDQDIWQSLLIPKTSEGKKAVGGGTKMTYRYYLQDMAFAVLLSVPEAEAPVIATALQAPVWDLYLGRKNCVPTDFIYRGLFADEQQARQAALELATAKERLELFQVLEGEHEGDVLTLNDVPLQFGEHKKYRDRRVTVVAM